MAGKISYEELTQKVEALEFEIAQLRQNEVSLKESARRYRKLLDFVPYPVAVFSLKGRVSYLNPAFTDVFGWTLEEMEGEQIPFVPTHLQAETSEKIKELFDQRIVPRYETKRFTKDGRLIPGAAYDDTATQKRIKEIRFSIHDLASGNVIKTGEPLIVNDTSKDLYIYPSRDMKFGHHFKNYVVVPIKSSDRRIGVLAAYNKPEGVFEHTDVELLKMIAGTVGLSITPTAGLFFIKIP